MQANNKAIKYYLLLLIVLLVVYLPLSSLHFAMKNDAFSDNFPDKYFLSQSLHAGIFPLWNPYMNFGFPVYADPGFAFWNPTTWLFALVGYSAYTLTIEVLLYIYLAGIFMFHFCKWLQFSLPVAFAVACMYMSSGFFVGSIQYINFITAAAFLPLLVQSFLQLIQKPCLTTASLLALSFALVAAGGHPAIPFGAVYLLAILFLALIFFQPRQIKNMRLFFLFLLLSICLFLLLVSPALYSYASIWNVYGRNTSQQHFEITNIGFSISSLISFLFPFSTTAHTSFFKNDVAMRNAYFSLVGFAAISLAFKTKSKLVYGFLITAIAMFILSLGGNFKESIYQYLPLLNYIRTNGEYRILFILMLCILSGFGLEQIMNNKEYFIKLKSFLKYFIVVCLLIILLIIVFYRSEITGLSPSTSTKYFSADFAKKIFENLNFPVAFIISLVLAIIISLFAVLSKTLSKKNLIPLIILDLILNAFFCLPVTGVGTTTVTQVQSFYKSNPAGIPVPPLIPVKNIDTLNEKLTALVGSISYYNKKIGTTRLTDYPSYFESTDNFFKSVKKDFVLSKPYLFLLNDINNYSINITHFEPQKIELTVQSAKNDSLIFLQNNYKFWQAFDNGKPVPISTAFTTFISIPISAGVHSIKFVYKDSALLFFCILSAVTLIAIIILLIRNPTNKICN